jgi:cyclohexadienyl dehydratase
MTSWRWNFAGFGLALILSAGSSEARTLAEIKASGMLRVGLTGDYAPYAVRGADGKFTGSDVTVAQILAGDLGIALKIVPTTWRSLKGDFESGRFDIAMGGVSITAERAAIGIFSQPVMSDGKRPIVRCTDKGRYTSIAAIDRPDIEVEVNPGGSNETFAKTHFPHARLREYPDNQTIFDDLAAGHADVMVTDGAEVDFQARRHPGVLCAANVSRAFDHFEKAYWMTPDLALKAAVDAVVKNSLDAGDYRKTIAQ